MQIPDAAILVTIDVESLYPSTIWSIRHPNALCHSHKVLLILCAWVGGTSSFIVMSCSVTAWKHLHGHGALIRWVQWSADKAFLISSLIIFPHTPHTERLPHPSRMHWGLMTAPLPLHTPTLPFHWHSLSEQTSWRLPHAVEEQLEYSWLCPAIKLEHQIMHHHNTKQWLVTVNLRAKWWLVHTNK